MDRKGVFLPVLAVLTVLFVLGSGAFLISTQKSEFRKKISNTPGDIVKIYQEAEQDKAFLYFSAQRAYDDTIYEFASNKGVDKSKCSVESEAVWISTCTIPSKNSFKVIFTKHLKAYLAQNNKLKEIPYDVFFEEESEDLVIRIIPKSGLIYTLTESKSTDDRRQVEVTYEDDTTVVLKKENPFTPYKRIYTQLKEDRKCLQDVNPIEKDPATCISEKFGFAWNLEKQKKEDNLIKGEVVLRQKVIVKEKETFIEKPVTILFVADLNNL